MATLEIWMDGKLIHSSEVTKKSQIWDAMATHNPKAARGGVVSLVMGGKREDIAISRHSTNGPTWGVL